VEIAHGDNISSYYANLQSGITVKEGQNLKQGDVIGGIGQSALMKTNSPPTSF
jgi:murein DD-endopeptidase MepM/ murein hydrolase activator NlpD